jgi:hypothetical protein
VDKKNIQDHEQHVHLRKCSRCGCGVLRTSTICEFCGGVLSLIAVLGHEISGVVCFNCGEQNEPKANECTLCGQTLMHTCPRCGQALPTDAVSCQTCDLLRPAFFAESVRKELARTESQAGKRRRADIADDVVALGLVTIFILVGWWQGFQREAAAWQILLLITFLYLLMWALAKSGR